MNEAEKKTYRLICHYVNSKRESVGKVRARTHEEALQYAEKYYTTLCMTVQIIQVYLDGELLINRRYC